MKRGGRIERRTRLKPVNEARLAARRARQFGPQAELCRKLPCCACKAPPPSDPEHVRTRGAGGLDADTIPLCRSCHELRHQHGPLKLVDRFWLPCLHDYFDWSKIPGYPSGYFEHVAAGLAAVLKISMGLALARGEALDRDIARAVYGSFAPDSLARARGLR